jgi:uncharacterized protein (DUF2147 family)
MTNRRFPCLHAMGIAGSAAAIASATASPALASDFDGFTGYWSAPDRSVIEVRPCPQATALCGYLVLARDYGNDAMNPDPALRKRPICGLPLLELRRFNDGVWREGSVYDPEDGKSYKAALRKRDGKLFLRAYIGTEVFGETETWQAAGNFNAPCVP